MTDVQGSVGSKCLNCGAELSGKFCSECGQRSDIKRITFVDTWNQFLSSSFSFEGPFLFTIKQLILNPGNLLKEYIAGRRKTYYQPVAFFILLSAIYLAIRALIGYDPLEGVPEAPAYGGEIEIAMRKAPRFMVKNINNIMFFLVLAIALMFKLFYRKRFNLSEYAVSGFYITGMYILLGIFFMLFVHFVVRLNGSFQMLFLLGYTVFVMAGLLNKRSFGSLLKVFLAAVLSILLYMILGFGFSLLWVSFLQ